MAIKKRKNQENNDSVAKKRVGRPRVIYHNQSEKKTKAVPLLKS